MLKATGANNNLLNIFRAKACIIFSIFLRLRILVIDDRILTAKIDNRRFYLDVGKESLSFKRQIAGLPFKELSVNER